MTEDRDPYYSTPGAMQLTVELQAEVFAWAHMAISELAPEPMTDDEAAAYEQGVAAGFAGTLETLRVHGYLNADAIEDAKESRGD